MRYIVREISLFCKEILCVGWGGGGTYTFTFNVIFLFTFNVIILFSGILYILFITIGFFYTVLKFFTMYTCQEKNTQCCSGICSGSCIIIKDKSRFFNVCCFVPDGVASDDSAVPGKNDEVRAPRRHGGRVCHHRRKCVWRLCQVWGE